MISASEAWIAASQRASTVAARLASAIRPSPLLAKSAVSFETTRASSRAWIRTARRPSARSSSLYAAATWKSIWLRTAIVWNSRCWTICLDAK